MKKKQTNTLGSWIDQSEMQRLTEALVPDDPELAGDQAGSLMNRVSGIGVPKPSLDIDQPTAYQAAPFPVADPQEPSEDMPPPFNEGGEGAAMRAARALAEVRLRAEESGFLKRRGQGEVAADSLVTAIPPVIDNRSEFPSNQEAIQEPTENKELVPFEVPQGPLRLRLDAFADWAMQLARASRIVIVDGQGYPLLHKDLGAGESESDSAMVDSAMRLISVLEQVQARTDFARDGAMNLPLEEGGWLGVLRCENAGGRLCIAVVTPVPLEIEKSAAMKNELARTMEAGG